MSEDLIPNEAVSFVGELFPECTDCCTALTGGDLCTRCLRALRIVIAAMRYAQTLRGGQDERNER